MREGAPASRAADRLPRVRPDGRVVGSSAALAASYLSRRARHSAADLSSPYRAAIAAALSSRVVIRLSLMVDIVPIVRHAGQGD